MAEELAKFRARLAASKTGGTAPAGRSDGNAKAAHLTRRDVVRGMLAGAAIATGLARTELELVNERRFYGPLTFKGVQIFHDSPPELAALERAWLACTNDGGGMPDFIVIREDELDAVWRYWKA